MVEDYLQELISYQNAKKVDTEPAFSKEHERSYPDKLGCKWFDDWQDAINEFVLPMLNQASNSFVFISQYDDNSIWSSKIKSTDFVDENENNPHFSLLHYCCYCDFAFFRFENDYWEWYSDSVRVWLCPLILPSKNPCKTTVCRTCNANIVWRKIKGKNRAFDANDFLPHKCPPQKLDKSLAVELRHLDQSFKRALESNS